MKKKNQTKFEYFKERVYYYQKMLGLQNFKISVFKDKLTDSKASWYSCDSGKIISIVIDEKVLKNENLKNLDELAFHEIYECQFYKIKFNLNLFFNDLYTSELIHEIVRRAENCIFPFICDKIKGEKNVK